MNKEINNSTAAGKKMWMELSIEGGTKPCDTSALCQQMGTQWA